MQSSQEAAMAAHVGLENFMSARPLARAMPYGALGSVRGHPIISRQRVAEQGVSTIALVDDHPVVLAGITAVFSDNPGFRIVATGSSLADVKAIAAEHRPDILLVDLKMDDCTLAAIAGIAEGFEPPRIIVFTASLNIDSAVKALRAGISGLVLKGATCDEILEAVETVARGEMFIARQYASQILVGLREKERSRTSDPANRLNMRERQIVDHLRQAKTNREIADSLSISEKTVKRYMTTLMQKLNARNRVEVAIHAQRQTAE